MEEILRLPSKPDQVTLELLSKARLLLEHSISHASTASPLDRMIAIHGLDNAIEYLLKIVAHHIDYESLSGESLDLELMGMARKLNKFLKENHGFSLPYLDQIKVIRQVRNLVQHGAFDPATDLSRFTIMVDRFYKKILDLVFGLSFKELRVSTLIKRSDVRKFLRLAESFMDNEKYLEAVIACRDAFENAHLQKCAYSKLKLSAAPALVEEKQRSKFGFWLFRDLVQEVEMSRLGLNPTKCERFFEILDHIPREYRAESKGGVRVMQRPWSHDDATFCYGFVADSVLQWQQEELEPLYQINKASFNKKPISWIEKLGNVSIKSKFEGGCKYLMENHEDITLHYVSRTAKNKLDKLVQGSIYDHLTERFENGKLVFRGQNKVELVHYSSRIATNNPERWEIILWLKELPFTWFREEFKEGEKISESPSINTASLGELSSIYKITKTIARKIVSYRKAVGSITCVNDLKNIEGIDDEQIDQIAYWTRL